MKKYDSYKDSGVEWIGKIPSSWSKSKFKYLTTKNVQYGVNSSSDNYIDDGIRFIRTTDIDNFGNLKPGGVFVSQNEIDESQITDYLDFLVSRSGTLGRTYLHKIDEQMTYGGYLVRFNFGKLITSQFLQYYCYSNNFWDWISLNTIVSTIGNVNGQKYNNMDVPFPPLSEQQQIVSFLDNKTTLIDSLIEKTQQKIELLKEKRTSLINEVVTKGLNPNVEMKESGVEWIGEIPCHWELLRLNNLGDFSKGKGITKDKIKESGHKCIRCGEIYTTYELRFNETNSFIDDETSSESILGFKGVLLFTGDGESLEEIGKCVVYEGEEELYIGGGINVFTPKQEKVIPIYLSYVMSSESVIYQKSRQGKGEIVVHIYSKQLKEIRLGLPPFTEQQQIVEYLDEQTGIIDKTISFEEKSIELLKEYRQSLISEVVTGKRKVV